MYVIGIGFGWLLSNKGPLIEGIFTSMIVGTFLYITTIRILTEEFNLDRYKLWKFIFFIFAITKISCIKFVILEEK